MLEQFIGNGTDVITLLLIFITGILTKRIVPWWVHQEVLDKLAEYEKAAPELITEIQRLVTELKVAEKAPARRVRVRVQTKRKDRDA